MNVLGGSAILGLEIFEQVGPGWFGWFDRDAVGGGQSRYSYSIKVGRVANKIGGVRTGVGRENPRGVLVALLERLEKAREEDGVAAAAALKLLRG